MIADYTERTLTQERLIRVLQTIPHDTRLIAVSKTKPVEMIKEVYDAGQRIFGENKALEMRDKYEALPKDIEWHFIGHLQTNKVKYIAPFVSMIHSIDSLELLEVVEKEAAKHDRTIDCLLQFHIAKEETKFGLTLDEARQILMSDSYKSMKHVAIAGVMGMATNTEDIWIVREEFKELRGIFLDIRNEFFPEDKRFREISMGMSNDYEIAIAEGSTLVRVGSKIFGPRDYNR